MSGLDGNGRSLKYRGAQDRSAEGIWRISMTMRGIRHKSLWFS